MEIFQSSLKRSRTKAGQCQENKINKNAHNRYQLFARSRIALSFQPLAKPLTPLSHASTHPGWNYSASSFYMASEESADGRELPDAQSRVINTLSADQKKANHIASEQKRRKAIKEEFDLIAGLIPGIKEAEVRSEATMLSRTNEVLLELIRENKELGDLAQKNGIAIPESNRVSYVNRK